MISNEELRKCAPQMGPGGWWESKTPEEKAYYLRLWALCRR